MLFVFIWLRSKLGFAYKVGGVGYAQAVVDAYGAHTCAAECCEVATAAESLSDVACKCADVGALAAHCAYGYFGGRK